MDEEINRLTYILKKQPLIDFVIITLTTINKNRNNRGSRYLIQKA